MPSTLALRDVVAAVHSLRESTPLVQCLTNTVVAGFTANALLAAGASPAMVDNPREAPLLAAGASAVLVNTGTPQRDEVEAMHAAAAAAAEHGTPWVLDPVAVGALPWRTEVAAALLAHRPAVVRGNASEVLALAGASGGGRGVDAAHTAEQALDAAASLAATTGGVVAVSGAVDHVVAAPGGRTVVVRVTGGHPLLTRVTGTGCALGALCAAYAGTGGDLLTAAVAAHAHTAAAATLAAARAVRPGSFAVAWLDALDAVGEEPEASLAAAVELS